MTVAIELIAEKLAARGDDIGRIEAALRAQEVETPSWAYGNSGTRFAVFAQPGVTARSVREARGRRRGSPAHGHRAVGRAAHPVGPRRRLRTGCASARRSSACASARSTRISSRSPSTSSAALCNPDPSIRRTRGRAHPRVRRDRRAVGVGRDLALARGRHELPGSGLAARATPRALVDACARSYDALPEGDAAARRVQALRAGVLRDRPRRLGLGAAALPGARRGGEGARRPRSSRAGREHRADRLAASTARAGSAASTSTTASTPTTISSSAPSTRIQLFLIFFELVDSGAIDEGVRFTVDQSHNVEPKIEAMIQTSINLQEAYAKALLIDRGELESAQAEGDVLAATAHCVDAFAPTSGRCARRCARSSAPRPIRSRRSVPAATPSGSRRPARRGKAAAWL